MRRAVWVLSVGGAALGLKLLLVFSVWALPLLLDAVNALLLAAVGVALAIQAVRRRGLTGLTLTAAILALAMLDLPLAKVVSQHRIRDAQAYCEALDACAAAQCAAWPGPNAHSIPKLPGRALPALLREGYSVRYVPSFSFRGSTGDCTFPDPFPGRSFWQGESGADGGAWVWENDMD